MLGLREGQSMRRLQGRSHDLHAKGGHSMKFTYETYENDQFLAGILLPVMDSVVL